MKTQHDVENERGKGPPARVLPPFHTQRTEGGGMTPPGPPLPPRRARKRWPWLVAIIVVLVLAMSLGAVLYTQWALQPTRHAQATPTPHATVVPTATEGNDVTPTPQAGVTLGPLACPAGAADATYWDQIFASSSISAKTVSVTCGNLMGVTKVQAMIVANTSNSGSPGYRSVFVFDNIPGGKPVTGLKPQLLFKAENLLLGDAKVSGYSTIMTAEVDPNSSINKGKSGDQLTRDLFREFAWNAGKGAFVQVAFPGFFPDMTRYQAEIDQTQQVKQGKDAWKNDAAKVAQQMAVTLLKWSSSAQTKALSGGGAQDVDAVVQVQNSSVGHPTMKVTLSRLEGNTHNMWVVIGAQTDGMSISAPQNRDLLSSPVTVKGTGSAFEGVVGTVYVFDHLNTEIGHAVAQGVKGMGATSFTTSVTYQASFRGAQEGVLALYTSSSADGSIAGVVMLKELMNR